MSRRGGDPEELRAFARTIRRSAETIADAEHRLSRQLEETFWEGPEALAFREAWVLDQAPALRRTADSLAQFDRQLVIQARRLEEWAEAGYAGPPVAVVQPGAEVPPRLIDEDESDDSQWYLLKHQNMNASQRSNGKRGWYYAQRREAIRGIVVHTTEAPTGRGLDIAAYFAQVDRPAAAHVIADITGIIRLLPDSYTAFHAKGGNAAGLGIEIQHYADRWGDAPEQDAQLVVVAAAWCALKAARYLIPPVRLTLEEWQGGKSGFIAHGDLDPTRRRDPGARFPWDRFLELVATGGLGGLVDLGAVRPRSASPHDRLGEGADRETPPALDPVESPPARVEEPTGYTVEEGDNMWVIARRHLAKDGASPTTGEVDAYWRKLIEANRDTIRSGDPNLIYPGEILEMPEP